VTYGLKAALSLIAGTVRTETQHKLHGSGETLQTITLHRWIGERYMYEIGARIGSGKQIQYTDKDIRRAVAYLRLINLVGAGLGKDAQRMRDRVREVASWHTNGWVVVTQGEVYYTDDTDHIWLIIDRGHPYLIIPCYVHLLSSERGS
jgi:hypothetical protein